MASRIHQRPRRERTRLIRPLDARVRSGGGGRREARENEETTEKTPAALPVAVLSDALAVAARGDAARLGLARVTHDRDASVRGGAGGASPLRSSPLRRRRTAVAVAVVVAGSSAGVLGRLGPRGTRRGFDGGGGDVCEGTNAVGLGGGVRVADACLPVSSTAFQRCCFFD